jgi:hypothetical protein
MAILQALIALIGRSAGRILNAIFGWAVRALFGATSGAQEALLTAVVAAAALWPLLLIGIAAPRIAAFAVAFVPISASVPDWVMRAIWIALAIAVPAIVGVALAWKAPPSEERTSSLVRLARGYPTTLAISIAFWLSFVSIPVMRLVTLARGRQNAFIPLITSGHGYDQAGARIHSVLQARGFGLVAREPGFWVRAPFQVLRTLGGASLRSYVPHRLIHLWAPDFTAALYPSSLLLTGTEQKTVLAHGILVEALTPCDAFQTTDPDAQNIEAQIRRVWAALARHREAHTDSPLLQSRLHDIVSDIARLEAPYDDWQTVYREALQLGRALRNEPQLLAQLEEGSDMRGQTTEGCADEHWHEAGRVPDLSTPELVRQIASKATQLVNKELELARAELRRDVASELAMAKTFAVAAVAALATLNLLLVAAVFALTPYVAGWIAALALAGVTLLVAIVAVLIGRSKHVRQPLARTRKTLVEDIQWAKEQMA